MLAILVGVAIGLVLGLTGAGGSVLAVPLLIFVLGMTPDEAVSLSLAAVFGSALLGVLIRLHKNEITWMPALFFAAGGMLLAPAGVVLAGYFPDTWRLGSFTVLMLIIAARMLWQSLREPLQARVLRAGSSADDAEPDASPLCPVSETRRFEPGFACIAVLALAGALTGILSGIYGVGGGFLIVPVLTLMTRLSMRRAVATSLLVITVISGTGFLGYVLHDGIARYAGNPTFLWVMTGALTGMLAGTWLSRLLAGPRLQQIFVVTIVAMAILTLWNLDSLAA
ncbi:MAG: sulfite exporter TauE/SafE family protein [Ketobacteraceae bacterium]|nr:sulfite exporter TauE/SafE family protein [Ketobacteraceae bacterium]